MNIFGVIMAGGGGTRFWPLSRQAKPKQLLNLSGKDIMINETIDRLQPTIHRENIYIVTSTLQAEVMKGATAGRVDADHILCEPASRNTAACIGYAAVHIAKRYGNGIMCVFPADHHIEDEGTFRTTIAGAIEHAQATEHLITIGLKPTFPCTGYGYIRYRHSMDETARPVLEFKEKPDLQTAQAYVASGDYAWNSGMFIWKASVILNTYRQLLPDLYADLMAIQEALGTSAEHRVIESVYPAIRKISIDFGVMEKSDQVVCIPADFGWDDVGSWDMMYVLHGKDQDGNITAGDVSCINTTNAVVYSSGRHISVIDMDDIVVVETADAVMVCKQSKAQNVKLAVEKLAVNDRREML